jgi:hypothetical protein
MGRGREAKTYGFCNENLDDILECCQKELSLLVKVVIFKAVCQKIKSAGKKFTTIAGALALGTATEMLKCDAPDATSWKRSST